MGLSAPWPAAAPPATFTRDLVAAFEGWRLEDVPASVIARLKLFVLDTLGVIAAAAGQREVGIVGARLARWAPGGSATALIGRRRLPPPFAALANGTAAHALDFDDIHDAARVHSFAVLVPALLAVAEDEGGVSGRDFLLALAIGAELNARLGRAAPRTLAIGWHPSTLFGTLSAAFAAARLMKLDADQQIGALGFAHHLAFGSSGSIVSGAASKRTGLGFAAQAAVMAAGLAADGISGPLEPLTGRSGLFALQLRGEADPAGILAGLGRRWEILAYQFKPYPCCRCCHSAISLGIGLHRDGIAPGQMARIEIALSRLNAETVGAPYEPARNSPSHAQFNAAFCFAAALADGQVGAATFTPLRFCDPRLVALAARTEVTTDSALPPEAMEPARVRLVLHDGTELVRSFATPDEAFDGAFDEAAVHAKARLNLAEGPGADAEATARLEAAVADLDSLADVAELVAAFPSA